MIEFVYSGGSARVAFGRVVWASSDFAEVEVTRALRQSYIVRDRPAVDEEGRILEDGRYGVVGSTENDLEAIRSLPGVVITSSPDLTARSS